MRVDSRTASTNSVAGSRGLRFLWLEITAKCNLECGHCYAESGPSRSLHGQMQRQDWLDVLREAAHLGCASCQFIGGEPTLHPDFRTFVAYARQLGMAVEVYTNATRLSEDLVGFLARNEVRIATSFYAEDESTHDRVTGRGGSWERTVGGIGRVVAAGLPLRVGYIETQHNAGQFPAAKRFLESLGVDRIGFDVERQIGRADATDCGDPMGQLCGQCSKGRLCITADAKAYPCVFSRFVELGDPRGGLAAILGAPPLTLFQTELDARFAAGGKESDCTPSILPCKPDQCEPAGCKPAFCNPNENCGPQDDCRPNNPCKPDEHPCVPDRCNPNLADSPGQLCSPQEIDRICSPHETCSPGKIEDSTGQLCSPQEIDRICSPHETCSPGK